MNVVANPDIHEILRRTFGFPGFRGQQEAVIGRVMRGQHSLALMPTGAGKSLCYQVPALARDGTAIIISPLIAPDARPDPLGRCARASALPR